MARTPSPSSVYPRIFQIWQRVISPPGCRSLPPSAVSLTSAGDIRDPSVLTVRSRTNRPWNPSLVSRDPGIFQVIPENPFLVSRLPSSYFFSLLTSVLFTSVSYDLLPLVPHRSTGEPQAPIVTVFPTVPQAPIVKVGGEQQLETLQSFITLYSIILQPILW